MTETDDNPSEPDGVAEDTERQDLGDEEPPAAQIRRVSGTGVPIRGNDIDTDQIIPARFMKVVTFEGLGQYAFYDQRFGDDEGSSTHPFDHARFQEASVLAVNANFGSGSSREHAPQALMRWGIDAIVGESFAEIFAGNCLALGIPTMTADHDTVTELQDWIEANPDSSIEVDIAGETVTYGDSAAAVEIDDTQRSALLEGTWDTTAVMRSNLDEVRETAESLPYVGTGEVPEAVDD